MNYPVALIYVAFFSLILGAVYITGTGYPLFALLLTPSFKQGTDDE